MTSAERRSLPVELTRCVPLTLKTWSPRSAQECTTSMPGPGAIASSVGEAPLCSLSLRTYLQPPGLSSLPHSVGTQQLYNNVP